VTSGPVDPQPDAALPLAGRVAIVTGAGRLRGIGRATALALARLGADTVVTGTGRDPASFPDDEKKIGWRDVESVAEEVRALGRRALPLVASVTDASSIDDMLRRTISELGRVDILVNNAAAPLGADRAPVVDVEADDFWRVVHVKLMGTFLCSRAVARQLIRQGEGGRIVNLSSTAGKRGNAGTAAYNAANFAVEGFTQALAKELAQYKVTVNAVCPGLTETSRMDPLGRSETWQKRIADIPLGRVASDSEVASLIAFLCRDDASFITGQAININGGAVTER
jgi:3-oxoacyl-[acyl-carrier protein] reductase